MAESISTKIILETIVKGAENATKSFDSIRKNMEKAEDASKKFAKTLAIGVTAVATGLALMVRNTANAADRIDKMSQKIGMSRKGFQEWDFILSQSGTSIDSMAMGMKSLTAKMEEAKNGAGRGAAVFERLGIIITDSMSQEDVFRQAVISLQGMEDGAEKAYLAQELFSRSGQELMPLLNQQAGYVDELTATYERLGLEISDEVIDAGVNYKDTMDQLKRSFGAIFIAVGSEVLPIFQKFADWFIVSGIPAIRNFIEIIKNVINWLSENTLIIKLVAGAIIGAMIPALVAWAKSIWFTVIPAIIKMGIALLPYMIAGAIIAGVVAGIWWIVTNWDLVEVKLMEIWEAIKQYFWTTVEAWKIMISDFFEWVKGIPEWAMGIVEGVFNSIMNQAKDIIGDAVEWMISKIMSLFNFIKDIPGKVMDSVKSVGSFLGSPVKSIMGKASGGPVSGGSPYIVGERGPELFVPRSSGNIVPNHKLGGGITINVNTMIGEDEFAHRLGNIITKELAHAIAY